MKNLGIKDRKRFDVASTLCDIALATVYVYRKRRGFNPYGKDISSLIRWGVVDKKRFDEELRELYNKIDRKSAFQKRIKLTLQDLGFT